MKRWIFFALLAAAALTGLPQEREPLKAEVELQVRVYDGGRPVAGLSQEQFRLSEDGEAREIRGFSENARGLGAGSGAAPRCFALVFTVLDYNAGLRAALDRLFASILRPQDQLLVLVNRAPLSFAEIGAGNETRAALDRLLVERAAAGRREMDQYVSKFALEYDMRKFRQAMQDEADESFRLGQWMKGYTESWREFRRQFLYPDREALLQMAQSLAKVPLEKWLVSFQQFEIHTHITMSRPEFRLIDAVIARLQDLQSRFESETTALMSSERRMRMLKELAEKALSLPDDFPASDMRRLLGLAGASFHAILMPAVVGKDSEVSQFELRRVTSGIEDVLQGVAQGAGGTLTVASDPGPAVAALAGASDVYYRMVYTAEVKKEGRIQVEVPGKRYTVAYTEVPRAGAPAGGAAPAAAAEAAATLQITGARFENRKLTLELGGFALAKEGKKIVGRVTIRVRIDDNNSDATVFDQSRDMVCDKATLVLAIDFPKLAAGFYTLTVEARDQLTGQQASDNRSLQVE